jgi:hypothetical protein
MQKIAQEVSLLTEFSNDIALKTLFKRVKSRL